MELSIEHLRKMRERYLWNGVSEVTAVLDELIAIRDLKGDQVPSFWHAEGKWITNDPKRVSHHPDKWEPLFTAPQKPVVIAPNRKDMFWTAANAGFVAKCDNEWKAVIEEAGGIVKDGE